jgi:L,D-transpeptidase catalytic domain
MPIAKLFVLPLVFLGTIRFSNSSHRVLKKSIVCKTEQPNGVDAGMRTLKQRAVVLRKFIQKNGYNDHYCFIINMAIASGSKRFFIYNLKNDSVENSGLVTHGWGSVQNGAELVFKNTINSLASSLGKYKIADSYYGQFGLAFKLYGLDPTNDKAFERAIVLHSMQCVPENPVFPEAICLSWGCPAVSPEFLKLLQAKISKSPKPVLLDLEYMK